MQRQQSTYECRVVDAEARINRLVTAIASGGKAFAEVLAALEKARANRDAATAILAASEALPDVAPLPTIADDYRRQVVALATGREPPESLTVKMERVKGIEPSS